MITKIVSIPLLRSIIPWMATGLHNVNELRLSGCSAQERSYRKSLSAKPKECIHEFPMVADEPLDSELSLSCLTYWVCSLKPVYSVEAASRLFIEALVSFSLAATEISLTLQTTTYPPKSPSARHSHQNLWKP